MSDDDTIPASDLIALIRRLRAEAADPPVLRSDSYAQFHAGVRHGKERAVAMLAELLAEYGVSIEPRTEEEREP